MTVEHARRGHISFQPLGNSFNSSGIANGSGQSCGAKRARLSYLTGSGFDFSHPKPVSANELKKVENISNQVILQNAPVETRIMAVDDAIEVGAMALFGEKIWR